MTALAIGLEDVGHRFGSRTVFSNVDLHVTTGQVWIVAGANGSGKSTLLRIVAGLMKPVAGSVTITADGREYGAMERRPLIGYVSPDLSLYRELTAAENLEFFGRARGLRLTKDDLIRALTEVGLRGRGRDLVGTYSSGMRQRLKYAFALLTRPPILLLDEPTANLDTDGIEIVERMVAEHRRRPGGGLAIVATNEPRELAWGDGVLRLEPLR